MLGLLILAAAAVGGEAATIRTTAARSRGSRTLVLTPSDMFKLADLAAARGDTETATRIGDALMADPNPDVRAEARFRRAKKFMSQSRGREAAVLLRQILDDKPDATGVRLELARQLQLLGDPDAALREVRAAQAAGLPPAVARLVDRYSEALRAARPAGFSVEIALAPDSNINRATRSDTLGTVLGDFAIDQESKAKSGTGLAVRAQAYRRFGLGRDGANLLVRAGGLADLYKATAFNDIALDLAAGPELQLGKDRLNLEIGALQRWFGQKPFIRSARLGASYSHALGLRSVLRLSAAAALIDHRVNDLQDGKSYSGEAEFEHALSPTTGVALNLGLNRQSLKDPGYATTGWSGGLTAWRDLGRVTLTAGAQLGRLHADERLLLFPERRADRYGKLSLGATFRQLQWRGFAPIARLSIERNRSTIAFYDYKRTRTELGIARAF